MLSSIRGLAAVSASASAMPRCSLSEKARRAPTKRTRMPFSCNSRTSLPSAPRNSSMSRLTSPSGRCQFSLLKVNRVSALTPRPVQCSMTRRAVSRPALCPRLRGNPRFLAQRPLPSMMMATCCGGGVSFSVMLLLAPARPPGICPARSDFEELGFLGGQDLVDVGDVLVGELLHLVLGAALLVLGDLAVLEQGLELSVGVAAHAAHRHPG